MKDPANEKFKEKYTRKMNDLQQFTDNFIFLAEEQRSKDSDVLRSVEFKISILCTIFIYVCV